MNDGNSLASHQNKIEWSLFLMRVGVFIVMLVWTVQAKLINPESQAGILKGFYFIDGVSTQLVMATGIIEMVIILAFLSGMWKKWTYGLVLLFHGLTTFASFDRYIPPDVTLLFFASWPMLAACVFLYLLRDLDTKFTLSKQQPSTEGI